PGSLSRLLLFLCTSRLPPRPPRFPYTTLFRSLPAPHARVLFGGIETAEHFGPRIRRWAGRLGIRDPAAVSVLGDGAEWVWNQARSEEQRLNSSHVSISYAVFCLKKKKKKHRQH